MTREELTEQYLSSTSKHFILQLPTNYGKSRLALQKVNQWFQPGFKILIVVPRLILIKNWKAEFIKWHYENLLSQTVFTTYNSLNKHLDTNWDVTIFDEGHHTSERCMDIMAGLRTSHIIVLSATLKKEHLFFFRNKYKPEVIQVKVKDAIENEVLPDPKLILIPLTLDNRSNTYYIEKNFKKGSPTNSWITIDYAQKWKYRGYKGAYRIKCTQKQYYDDLSNLIEWYKNKGKVNARFKNMWLHKAGERLKWLAQQKLTVVQSLLKELRNYRTLIFCPSIEDSNKVGSPCINSKVGTGNLERFNDKQIKHIAAVGMLDEGCNLIDCKAGIFQMINASDRITIQRIGRILRHKEPVLIFPYYVNTREQEIVDDIAKDYNPNLIIKLNTYNIKQYM